MAATVVPLQAQSIHASTEALVQNALQVFHLFVPSAFGIGRFAEEVGRRKLFGVPDYRQLLSTGNSANGIPHRNLRGLVKDHQVKWSVSRIKVLGNRKW